ncbi:DNA methyltransferase [Staphylococcus hominis]|uniref:DNA methyltransferase n=1 Tax=Staphylococcus hominis TaxID=1290 RepID=UPI000765343C|nr:site-specific DNA-methyltransferase [Staphylococcus hominis]MCI2924566.1 site-specific DNA-methyltransferase [Staphylococcus hominis]OFK79990.1 hypothetical protein HMPREF2799_10540 [Staphylococcus sp. HMSC057A02]CVY30209.1 Type III restriction-modification system methylation subunit [Staphylococcus hominis]
MQELTNQAKQRFFSALSNTFVGEVGAKLEGKSGYTNLMKIRNEYFKQIRPLIEREISNEFEGIEEAQGDLYNKLYTFFASYLNETGTPFYNKTQLHKNLYERVYSERQDTSLFWKTQRLYYVKTETMFNSMKFDLNGFTFDFDASEIEHQKSNEKKEVEFQLIDVTDYKLRFKVQYKDNSTKKFDRLKKYLGLKKPEAIKDYIFQNINDFNHSNIIIENNGIKLENFNSKTAFRSIVDVQNLDDTLETVLIRLAITNFNDMLNYLDKLSIDINEDILKKAFSIYKKQKEVDYFIHKDASSFLKEQFNQFLYDYLFNENEINAIWDVNRLKEIQKLKKIAFKIIEYIAKFENELKEIWLKPKFVKNSNYIITLDRIKDLKVIEKIINSDGFDNQIQDWINLFEKEIDEETGEVIKKEWKEFQFSKQLNKEDIIQETETGEKKLNEKFKHLPIDTKYFRELKNEILDTFNNIDDVIDGLLIKSDNFQALNTLIPKFEKSIQLVYIDPPFNTGDDFDYKDNFQDSTWLTLMENRIALSRDLLKQSGSFYLHLDEDANYLGRMLMDKEFGKENFRREIIWDIQVLSGFKVVGAKNNWVLGHQSIYFYTKDNNYLYNKIVQPQSLKYLESFNKTDENDRKYQVAHGRRIYKDEVVQKGKPFGDVWNQLRDLIDIERPFPEVWKEITANLNFELPMQSVWADIMSFQQQPTSSERVIFDTQKPEKLLERIIKSSTNKGDWVLDYFAGSGTTGSTSIKTGRKFINCEMGEHFEKVILPRMKRTLIGHVTSVSEKNNYRGGGFLKYYELEQYEDVLNKAKYTTAECGNEASIFYNSEKLLDAIKIEDGDLKISIDDLYDDVDLVETISNLTGRRIEKLNSDRVIFTDGSRIDLQNILWKTHKYLRPLIWWGQNHGE